MTRTIVYVGLLLVLLAPTAAAEEADFRTLANGQDAAVREKGQRSVLDEARKRAEADPTLVNHLLLARMLPPAEAVQMLAKLAREAPASADLQVLLSRAHLESGKARSADKAGREATKLAPDDPRGYFAVGQANEGLGKLPTAESFYRTGLAKDKGHVDTLIALALLLHRLDKSDQALALLEGATSRNEDPRLLLGLGDLLVVRREFDQAIEIYTKIMGNDAWRPDALARRGQAGMRKGDVEKASRDLAQAVRLLPRSYMPRYHLGVVLEWQAKPEEAHAAYQAAAEINPKRPEAPSREAYLSYKEGDLKGAEKKLKKVIKIAPNYLPARIYLAQVLQGGKGDLNGARKAYGDALKIDATCFEAHLNLARIQRDLGKLPDALRSARRAVDLRPRDSIGLTVLGEVYLGMKKYDDATEILLLAKDVNPKNPKAWRTHGRVFEAQERFDEAMAQYEAAVELDGDDTFSRYLLGYLAYELGDNERALQHLMHYLELVGGDKEVESIVEQLNGG